MDLFETYSATSNGLKLLSINVQSPPKARAQQLAKAIVSLSPNVLVLSELSSGDGSELLIQLLYQSYYSSNWLKPSKNEYSSAILVKNLDYRHLGFSAPYGKERIRFTRVKISGKNICIVGLYVPALNAANMAKRVKYFKTLEILIRKFKDKYNDPLIVTGDINSISEDHKPMYGRFMEEGFTFYKMMSRFSLIDFCSTMHDTQQYSWYSLEGDGQLLDNTFVSKSIISELVLCDIEKSFLRDKLSDHCGILVEGL